MLLGAISRSKKGNENFFWSVRSSTVKSLCYYGLCCVGVWIVVMSCGERMSRSMQSEGEVTIHEKKKIIIRS